MEQVDVTAPVAILLENHRLPIVVAQALVGSVRLHEPADQVGVAILMGSLLSQGTKTRTGPVISQLIEDAGGALSMRSSGGTVKVLSGDTDLGLDLLFDCLMNAEFDKDDLESKRYQILNQLAEDEQTAEQTGRVARIVGEVRRGGQQRDLHGRHQQERHRGQGAERDDALSGRASPPFSIRRQPRLPSGPHRRDASQSGDRSR